MKVSTFDGGGLVRDFEDPRVEADRRLLLRVDDAVDGPNPELTVVLPLPACTRATRGPTLALIPDPDARIRTPGAIRKLIPDPHLLTLAVILGRCPPTR
jgi:hypothetical protein